jgi:membrane protein YqaA with SNARE-associated domain
LRGDGIDVNSMVNVQSWRERALSIVQRRRWLLSVLAFVPIVAFSAIVLFGGQRVQDLQDAQALGGLGLVGAFTVNLLGSGTFVLPVPGVLATFFIGAQLKAPLLVGLVSAAGSTIGELTGYLAGMGAEPAIERIGFLRRVEAWMQRSGALVIFIFALVPNPFFDFVGFAAGSMDYPVKRFLVFCALGKTLKFVTIAYAGYYGVEAALRYFSAT